MRTLDVQGARIPVLGLGTWQLRDRLCEDRVRDALALGYRHVDTARMYDNHREVGRGIRRSGVPRDEIFLTTKLWSDELERKLVLEHTEQYLRELDTDYLDLLLIHWPSDTVPLEETLDAMLELREAGRPDPARRRQQLHAQLAGSGRGACSADLQPGGVPSAAVARSSPGTAVRARHGAGGVQPAGSGQRPAQPHAARDRARP